MSHPCLFPNILRSVFDTPLTCTAAIPSFTPNRHNELVEQKPNERVHQSRRGGELTKLSVPPQTSPQPSPPTKVTIINFTVTMTGLEDQLLVDVVKNERPDLEAKKDELVWIGQYYSIRSSMYPPIRIDLDASHASIFSELFLTMLWYNISLAPCSIVK